MKIGIIVLNWNGKKDTLSCLESLSNSDWTSRCLLVVDNGSIDGSVEAIFHWGTTQGWQVYVLDQTAIQKRQDQQKNKNSIFNPKQLFVLKLGENRGYTGGNNAGFTWLLQYCVDAVLILNNDIWVEPDAIRRMADTLKQRRDVGIVGCKIMNYDNDRIQYQGGNLSYWLGVYYLRRFRGHPQGTIKVNFVPGCAMLVRASVLRRIGGFRDDLFAYTDDIEFCHRVHNAGWILVVNLDAVVRHRLSQAMGKRRSSIYYYFVTRNTLIFIMEELGGIQRVVALIMFMLARFLQIILWISTGQRDRIKGVVRGIIDFARGVRGQGWAAQHLMVLPTHKMEDSSLQGM